MRGIIIAKNEGEKKFFSDHNKLVDKNFLIMK